MAAPVHRAKKTESASAAVEAPPPSPQGAHRDESRVEAIRPGLAAAARSQQVDEVNAPFGQLSLQAPEADQRGRRRQPQAVASAPPEEGVTEEHREQDDRGILGEHGEAGQRRAAQCQRPASPVHTRGKDRDGGRRQGHHRDIPHHVNGGGDARREHDE